MGTALTIIVAIILFLVLLVAWGALVGGSCKTTEGCPKGYECTGGRCQPPAAPASFRPWRAGPSPPGGRAPCPPGLIARGGLRGIQGGCVPPPDLLFRPPGAGPRV